MTIDERLEALVQSLRLRAQMHRDHEVLHAADLAASEKRMAELDKRMGEVMEAINRLARVAGLQP